MVAMAWARGLVGFFAGRMENQHRDVGRVERRVGWRRHAGRYEPRRFGAGCLGVCQKDPGMQLGEGVVQIVEAGARVAVGEQGPLAPSAVKAVW